MALLILAVALGWSPAAESRWATGPTRATDEAALAWPGVASPALAALFTPRHAPAGAYEVRVLKAGIEEARNLVWQAVGREDSAGSGGPPPAWRVQELGPLEVFGEAGEYPHTEVARLYTGRHASVIRAPIVRGTRTVAAVTLLSPYPDPTLSHLENGTMMIVIRIR